MLAQQYQKKMLNVTKITISLQKDYNYIICQLKDLILTLFGLFFRRIYIYIQK